MRKSHVSIRPLEVDYYRPSSFKLPTSNPDHISPSSSTGIPTLPHPTPDDTQVASPIPFSVTNVPEDRGYATQDNDRVTQTSLRASGKLRARREKPLAAVLPIVTPGAPGHRGICKQSARRDLRGTSFLAPNRTEDQSQARAGPLHRDGRPLEDEARLFRHRQSVDDRVWVAWIGKLQVRFLIAWCWFCHQGCHSIALENLQSLHRDGRVRKSW
ncbi:hypothetical protein EDB86DRAFT_1605528 [Lactarius hatsudake]|nr:hypothetical protein EDB86DRAFT_1605528 [Lactarius hatsudake]